MPCPRPAFRYSHRWVESLSLATRDTVLKGFPDAIETADVQDLDDGFDRGHKGSGFTIRIEKNDVGPGGG